MATGGFIVLNRSLLDWEWYDDINTTRLFVHLLLTANYKDKQWHGITIKRGQRVASYATLSEETGLTYKSVRTSIDRLKTAGCLAGATAGNFTLYTLLNYGKYQNMGRQEGTEQGRPRADQGQQHNNSNKDNHKTTLKENGVTNVTPKKKDQHFDEFWSLYPKKRSKAQAKKAWNTIKPSSELLAKMLRVLAEAKKSKDWTKQEGQYIPYPATWLNAQGWEDEMEVKALDQEQEFKCPDLGVFD